jgi:hypothetical protein
MPTTTGRFNGSYVVTGDDGAGPQTIQFTGYAVAPGPAVISGPASGSWYLNGSAVRGGPGLVLTPRTTWRAGDAIYPTPVFGAGLRATFTTTISGGTGGSGLTFALLDANRATPRSLGISGEYLGWAPMPGVAVVVGAGRNAPSNTIGIATGSTRAGLVFAATQRVPQSLRAGSHLVAVSTTATTITVRIDGGPPLTATVAIPQRALLAFTAGTGWVTEVHAIGGVTITQHVPVGPIVGVARRCADARGTLVRLYNCNRTSAQTWTLLPTRTVRALGRCLTVVGGGRVGLLACTGSSAQVWVPVSGGRLQNPRTGRCLAVTSPIGASGSPLQILTCSVAANQRWTLPR